MFTITIRCMNCSDSLIGVKGLILRSSDQQVAIIKPIMHFQQSCPVCHKSCVQYEFIDQEMFKEEKN